MDEDLHSERSVLVSDKDKVLALVGMNDHTENSIIGDFCISPQFHVLELILQSRHFIRLFLRLQIGISIIR
jgi:hypothetical protein